MSPSLIIYNNYILLLRGNHWVAIRKSKGRPSQKGDLRCILVGDRKTNIHVNTYSPYYWSDNQSRDKNVHLIFCKCTHRVLSQQHILITMFCLNLDGWVDFTLSLRNAFLQSGTFSLFRTTCNVVGTPNVSFFMYLSTLFNPYFMMHISRIST